MVVVHLLVGILRAGGLDQLLHLFDLGGAGCGVKDPDVHLCGDGEGSKHILLQSVCGAGIQILHTVGTAIVSQKLLIVEVVFIAAIVLQHGSQYLLPEAGVLDPTGNQVSGLLTADDVLHTDTVLDILDRDLIPEGGVLIAAEFLLLAVIRVLDDDLGEILILDAFRRIAGSHIIGVGTDDLTGDSILHRHLTGVLVTVDLIVALCELQLHSGEFILRCGEHLCQIIDLIFLFRFRLSRCLLSRHRDSENRHDTAQHDNS